MDPATIATIIASGAQAVSSIGSLFSSSGNKGMSWGNFKRMQDQIDYANPLEISRNNEFLKGTTPTQIEMFNMFEDQTFQGRLDRQQQTMNTLFPGTTPWERLGTSAAQPMSVVGPAKTGPSGQAGQFLSAAMAQETQLEATKLQSLTSLAQSLLGYKASTDTASINTGNQMEIEKLRQSPESTQSQTSKASLLQGSSSVKNAQMNEMRVKLDSDKFKYQQEIDQRRLVLDSVKTLVNNLPQQRLKTFIGELSQKPGLDLLAQTLSKNIAENRANVPSKLVTNLNLTELDQLRQTMLKHMGVANDVVDNTSNMIGNILNMLVDKTQSKVVK